MIPNLFFRYERLKEVLCVCEYVQVPLVVDGCTAYDRGPQHLLPRIEHTITTPTYALLTQAQARLLLSLTLHT